ncbi:MAG: hypothetical protein COB24_06355 [Hyphomicrobiales bacterium]|nr:MAG: hypothetical protein COB24_06355 [Hyphomicrobiales bacterium]
MQFRHLIFGAMASLISLTSISAVFASDFPQTFEHRYGTTIIDKKPIRVVTISYNGPDNLLALGVIPVAVRNWFDYDYNTGPWAQEALGDAKPVVLKGDLSIEQIAALAPDVIVGMYSGISEEQYALLSQIAPVIAAEKQYTNYSTPWHVRAKTIGRVVGEAEKADAMVAALEQRIVDIAASHPEWKGKTAAVAHAGKMASGGGPIVYRSIDPRPALIAQFGFVTPKKIDDLGAPEKFNAELSLEDLSPIDVDLLIWNIGDEEFDLVKNLTLRKTLNAHKQGRELVVDDVSSGALSYNSLLSLSYLFDALVPLIELAVDGDPATIVPTTKAAGLLD